MPKEKVLFAGDLVEAHAALYCGDAYLTDWPGTLKKLRALKPRKLVPGRGPAAMTPKQCMAAMDSTEGFVKDLMRNARYGVDRGWDLKQTFDRAHKLMTKKYGDWAIYEHCIPFNVSRAYDEASGIVDPRTGVLTYCNAGHNPPLLLRAGGEAAELAAEGTVLGILPELGYEQRTAQLNPGDIVVVFSDGVTEATKPGDDEEFGVDRLREVVTAHRHLSAAEIIDAINKALADFTDDSASQADDLTIVVVRRADADGA